MRTLALMLVAAALLAPGASRAETPEEWVTLGSRVHGAFGAFLPVGIRIGNDALARLKAEPRSVTVTYYSGDKPPCPCVADGVMLATHASPGQGTLQISQEKAPVGIMAVIVVRDRKSGEGVRYTMADEWLPRILGWNREFDALGRYKAAMAAENMFEVMPVK